MNPFLQRRVTCPPTGKCRRCFPRSHVLVEAFGLHTGKITIAEILPRTGGKGDARTYFHWTIYTCTAQSLLLLPCILYLPSIRCHLLRPLHACMPPWLRPDHCLQPATCLGNGTARIPWVACSSFGIPIIVQQGWHSGHGLSPNRMSPTMDQTAGTREQPRQRSS